MEEISTVGIDIAKSVFQVHAIDVGGNVVVRRQLRRQQMLKFFAQVPPCLIGIEACGTAHYWARELSALGHDVRLMPPAYVKPYVKRQKNDAADAEAICEAVTRPTMRFVPVKSVEQQSAAMLHRSRALLIKQRTMLLHSIRAHLAELGISIGVGTSQVVRVVRELAEGERSDLPELILCTDVSGVMAAIGDGVSGYSVGDEVYAMVRFPEDLMKGSGAYPRDGVMESFKVITDAVPDYRWNIQDLFVVDDRIAVRLQNTGTPIKTFVGHVPTGRSVNFMEFASYRIRDGRFTEMWFLMDEATVAKQLSGTL